MHACTLYAFPLFGLRLAQISLWNRLFAQQFLINLSSLLLPPFYLDSDLFPLFCPYSSLPGFGGVIRCRINMAMQRLRLAS